jgi:hypothetical protein
MSATAPLLGVVIGAVVTLVGTFTTTVYNLRKDRLTAAKDSKRDRLNRLTADRKLVLVG